MADRDIPAHRTVTVTGAAGFLGARVVRLLSDAGATEVIATDVVRSERAEQLDLLPGVRFVGVDLRDAQKVGELVDASDAVVHLAAVRTNATQDDPRTGFDVNVAATFDIVGHAARSGVDRFVYGSSHMVYGSFGAPRAVPLTEDDARIRPGLTHYAAGKLAVESFLSAFAATGGLDYLSMRFGTIYGPYANVDSVAGVLLDILDALDAGNRPSVPWTRDTLHGLTYVDDAARAVLAALDTDRTAMPVNVVGPPVTAESIYTTIVELAGGDPATIDWRDERSRYQLVSSDRLRSELGFGDWTSMKEGLTALVDWHRSSRT